MLSFTRALLCNRSTNAILTKNFTKITIADNGSTFVAFHPEKKIPYELTHPLPEEPVNNSKSVLRMDDITEVKRVFKDVSPEVAREHLMNMTLTTKHRWFPRSRDKRKKNTPMDRKYL